MPDNDNQTPDHQTRSHARLSASGAHRWLVCPASVRMEDGQPDSSSPFAEYGTAAHELAERCLREDLSANHLAGQEFNGHIADDDMIEAVQSYLDFVRDHKGRKLIEQRVDFSPWVPDGFGTCDCLILGDDAVSVIDLKMGQGVRVEAEDNPQAMLYALGALNEYGFLFEDVPAFRLVIVQPRLDHISEHVISREDLLAFGDYARERAAVALSGEGEAVPDHKACRFCKAKAVCRPLAEYSLGIAAEGFSAIGEPLQLKQPDSLSRGEIAALLPQLATLVDWTKALEAHAIHQLQQGRDVPGFKLVAGRSIRKWEDETAAEIALREELAGADLFTRKLISPAQAEKQLGRGHSILARFTTKPDGKPTLAPLSDKRPALEGNPAAGFEATFPVTDQAA